MSIEVEGISKAFGRYQALRDVSLRVNDGELVALLGPSGCGKTTLLRVIAGLEPADSGTVRFDGQDASERSAGDRRVGFVFQHYALFRHMTILENVAFGLRVRPRGVRPSRQAIRNKVGQLLELVQLGGLAGRRPNQLSGGQRQRVALARALAVEPKVLLLDEPFGSLDAKVRKELRRWLRRLPDELHVSSVFVTHDQEEALEVADRVAIMNLGRIEQAGTPAEVYDHPANAFVYDFLGNVNLFQGRIQGGRARIADIDLAAPAGSSDGPAVGYARPFELRVVRHAPRGGAVIPATVTFVGTTGPAVRLELRRDDTGDRLEAEISKEEFQNLRVGPGDRVFVSPRNLRVFVEDFSI